MAGNQHPTPADSIRILLNCTQEHLATRDDLPDPAFILTGAQGVSIPYGCCDGILVVESRGPVAFDRSQQAQLSNIAGCDPCDAVPHNEYRVTFKMCAPPFDNKSVYTGAPVEVAERNNLAMLVMTEMWELFQALSCCVPCEYARVHSANHKIVNGCATFWVNIAMEHEICC